MANGAMIEGEVVANVVTDAIDMLLDGVKPR